MWKKFIVYLSLKNFHLIGILWFKNKIIPIVIISRKYLVLALSTFIGRKLVKRELGK